jgi:hemerythrin-like metal-binding protein
MELITYANARIPGARVFVEPPKELITWTSKLSVGVKIIDEQHRKLIDLINQLSDSMYSGRSQNMMFKVLIGLEMYAMTHFDTEEELMCLYNYEESDTHKTGHLVFTDTVRDFRHKFESGSILISIEIMAFLREWLITHIMKTDKQFGQALIRLGVE